MLISIIYFYHVTSLSLSLTLPGGHKINAKQNLKASFFPTFFHLIRMKFDVMKHFKFNIIGLLLSNVYWIWNEKYLAAVLQTACMHSDVYESIWFKLSVRIDLLHCTFWYWSNCPWPWFKVTRVPESQNCCTHYLTKFLIDLNGIWYAIETCCSDAPHSYSFYLTHSIFQCSLEKTLLKLYDFV